MTRRSRTRCDVTPTYRKWEYTKAYSQGPRQCCQTYGFIRTNTDFWHYTELTYGISKNTDFLRFLTDFSFFHQFSQFFLVTSYDFSELTVLFRVKGVWCNSVTSTITKCWSIHRSDHNLLEWECRFTLGLNAATNTDYIKACF